MITTSSYSGETREESDRGKIRSALENRNLDLRDLNTTIGKSQRETFGSIPAQHPRYRRNIQQISESATEMTQCKNFTFVIKYEDRYEVLNNFSVKYKGKIYPYDSYRLYKDGLHVCNSSDDLIQQRWRNVTVQHKQRIPYKHCRVSVDSFYHENYTLFKDFNVFLKPTNQNFTSEDYGVISGYFSICSAKLSLSCNDYLLKVKYSEQYNVFNDFSLMYYNRKYDYREYRINNNTIEMCASNHSIILHIWKTRNSLEKSTFLSSLRCNKRIELYKQFYTINKQFTVYHSKSNQYFKNHMYNVEDGILYVCKDTLRPDSFHFTQEDLLMCNDSIINVTYDDEYKVCNNFSILYKDKMYSYTEYRALNDSIKICNSTDNFVKNNWKLRNDWVMGTRHLSSCNFEYWIFDKPYYLINKQFTVYEYRTSQYFTRHDYSVNDGELTICIEIIRPDSYQYTKEDLLMCNDSIINIKYDDEYKVWNNFSIFYKNKMYSYTEYRALNDGIKICNSTDNFVSNIWKLRNDWVMGTRHLKSCNTDWTLHKPHYIINKDFTVYASSNSQYFTKNEYDVRDGELFVCKEVVRSDSYRYTQEDLLMCNNSMIDIKYDDEYKVWNNFSILYKNKMYSYTEYRALNDSIKICNSTDNFVKNIWKLRNNWLMGTRHLKSCNFNYTTFYKSYYIINKDFTVYASSNSQYFIKNDYDVRDGDLVVCKEVVRPDSYQYTKEDLLMCNDSIINIKYDDEYKVWNNFSILYKNKMYSYTEYRDLNDSINICNSTNNFKKNIWKLRNDWIIGRRHLKSCNFNYTTFYKPYYIINKDFTVYASGSSQYFTKHDYDVRDGDLVVCRENARPDSHQYTKEDLLMCNDSIINIKYDDEYKVWKNFSIFYKNKMYSYTEYRALNDSIKICNSTDKFVKNIWKFRNDWVMARRHLKSCNKTIWSFYKPFYSINKEFTVYYSGTSQRFTRDDYDVRDGNPVVCHEMLRPDPYQYTKEDLLMCNDSIINIKYDDEYKVWNNFSILYKNKMYSYTEYRALNDSIKICNSTDTFVKNIWKLRNYLVILKRIFNSCSKPVVDFPLFKGEYDALKNFTVLIRATKLLIAKNDYGIFNGIPFLCVNKCVNATSTINYEDEQTVWNNFSMTYKGEMFHYFEYRVTDNGLQICNSSDRLFKEKWRNVTALEKRWTAYKNCDADISGFYHENYTVHKNFSLYFKPINQSFLRQDYGVISGYLAICSAKLNLSCDESLLEVKYGEQYEVFKNFSVFYNNTVYDYPEYQFSRYGVKICSSDDARIQGIWKTQNKWGKSMGAPCDHSYKLNSREYTVTKRFAIHSTADGQIFNRYEYAVIDDFPYVCQKPARPKYIIVDVKIIAVPLFALAVSFICLVLLLVIYCLLPDLRTLPGLNLMSLCFAFLIWQIYLVAFLSSYSDVSKLSSIPCERLFVINKFITYSIIMNAVVNVYHLRQTFCGDAPVKSEKSNKWWKFLKYTVFNWGVPLAVTIVYIVLVKTQALQFNQHDISQKGGVQSSLRFYQHIELADEDTKGHVLEVDAHTLTSVTKNVAPYLRAGQNFGDEGRPNISIRKNKSESKRFYKRVVLENENDDERIYHHITGDCINGRITPTWSTAVDVYGIQGCLILYVSVTFILTAYQIRQKLKAGGRIAQNSNVVRHRKFILLLKLSTTTALSYWFPMFLSQKIDVNFNVKIALYTVTLLTGVYIGIAFGLTRRNYQLLKTKYFPAKERPVNKRVAAN